MNRLSTWVFSVLVATVSAACSESSSPKPDATGGSSSHCAPEQSPCGASCLDLKTDSKNCGSCGHACAVGQTCVAGSCACASGLKACDSACIDTQSDFEHCGSCTNACTGTQVCSQGTCSSTGCGSNLTQCGASCYDLLTSTLNCGSCNSPCQNNQRCQQGACVCANVDEAFCGGACVNTQTNTANCGACGNQCGSGQRCDTGACVSGTSAGGAGSTTNGAGGSLGGVGATTAGAGGSGASVASPSGGRGGGQAGGASGSTGGRSTTGGSSSAAPSGGSGGANIGGTTANVISAGGSTAASEPVLVTSADGAWWKEGSVTTLSSGNPTVTVTPGTVYQKWIGFGGCFNEKGWDALSKLSSSDRELALKLLFSKTEGAGFTYGRLPIGASDYAMDRYTLDETANDTSMSKFSIDRDKQKLIPYIKAALAVNPNIILWATPWTPPTWMKDNKAFDHGNMKSDATTLQALALYFSKFIQAYSDEGVKIAAVGPQNEPGYSQDYPSCLWSATVMKDFIANYMGPQLAKDAPSTEIWLATMSNPSDTSHVTAVMGDSKAKGYVKAIGLQWGMMDQGASYANTYNPLPIVQTEHKCGNYPWESGYKSDKAPNDVAYANESWGYIRDWIVKQKGNSYNAWNMVLDTIGKSLDTVRPWNQNAPLAVDAGAGKLIQTPAYYVFRHAAQFVDPGAVRIQTSASDGFAFKNPDGHIVLVFHTTSAQQITVGIGSTNLQFQVPGPGWATLNYQGG